jgi:general secretion pathway protein B
MSYILEAIKKSDRERQRNISSSLALPQAEFRTRRGGTHTAAWVMAGALLVASGVGGALLATAWRDSNRDVSGAVEPGSAIVLPSSPASVSAAASTGQAAAAIAPAQATATPAMPAIEDITAPAVGLLEVWELGEAEQRYLGELEVSFHVWSSDPLQRAAIVNGLRAKEGQSLGHDLRLLEITEDGLIVEFQGKHVHLATVHAS